MNKPNWTCPKCRRTIDGRVTPHQHYRMEHAPKPIEKLLSKKQAIELSETLSKQKWPITRK